MRDDDWTGKADHAKQVVALMQSGDLKRQWELIERNFRSHGARQRPARGTRVPPGDEPPPPDEAPPAPPHRDDTADT
jgi:hypothetical protein